MEDADDVSVDPHADERASEEPRHPVVAATAATIVREQIDPRFMGPLPAASFAPNLPWAARNRRLVCLSIGRLTYTPLTMP